MLYYDRIDISKEIDPTKSNKSKECIICHYFFFNHGFKFQDSVCNGCHDLTMFSVNISDIAIITVTNVILLLSLLKMLIIVVLFITLADLKQLTYQKNSVLEDRGYIYKNIVLNFSLLKAIFFTCFVLPYIKSLIVWIVLILEQ